jgi:GDP-L-fucose synthase
MAKKHRVFIAGHNGMVGSAVLKILKKKKNFKILTRNKKQLNLLNQKKVFDFLKKNNPDYVIIAAAKVGGILSNMKFKHDFLYENLQIQNNLIQGSFEAGVKNLLFLGSSCIYPKNSKQPIKESYLMNGLLEETNDAYAIAKISGLKLCQYIKEEYKLNYKSLMPTNLYGPGDNYDLEKSHFFPALIKKAVNAKIYKKRAIEIWGTGKPLRELMHVDDLADAVVFFLKKKIRENYINIGSGTELSIKSYLDKIMKILNLNLKIKYNKSMPDGVKRKKLDSSISRAYGWRPKISLDEGIRQVITEYMKSYK